MEAPLTVEPEHPDGDVHAGRDRRHDGHAVGGTGLAEPALQVVDGLGEGLRLGRGAAEHLRGQLVGARGAAEPEVDPVAVEVGQGTVAFGDHERGVVGQHDPARPDPDALGDRGGLRDEQLGGARGEVRGVVVLCEPQPPVAEPLGELGRGHRRGDGVAGGGTLRDGDEVEDARGTGTVHNFRLRDGLLATLQCPGFRHSMQKPGRAWRPRSQQGSGWGSRGDHVGGFDPTVSQAGDDRMYAGEGEGRCRPGGAAWKPRSRRSPTSARVVILAQRPCRPADHALVAASSGVSPAIRAVSRRRVLAQFPCRPS